MRVPLLLACLMFGPLGMPAGPSGTISLHLPTPVGSLVVTEDQVQVWIEKWQKRLGLEEWTIEGRVVRTTDLPPGAVANIHWSLPKHTATLRVLSSADYSLRKADIPRDTELSVVHELVHLSMAKLPLDPNHTELEEDTVRKISTALLNLETPQPVVQARRAN